MAYMNQDKKKAIAARIKAEFPNWSVRLAVRHHRGIVVTIVRADVDLLGIAKAVSKVKMQEDINYRRELNYRREFENGTEVYGKMETYFGEGTEATEVMKKFMDCVNLVGHPEFANFDKSDCMSDYYHVGYYTDVKVGGDTESTAFEYKEAKPKKAKKVNAVSANDENFAEVA